MSYVPRANLSLFWGQQHANVAVPLIGLGLPELVADCRSTTQERRDALRLFEKLYFVAVPGLHLRRLQFFTVQMRIGGGGTPTPSNAVGSFTPRSAPRLRAPSAAIPKRAFLSAKGASTTPASFLESGPGPTLLTLKAAGQRGSGAGKGDRDLSDTTGTGHRGQSPKQLPKQRPQM